MSTEESAQSTVEHGKPTEFMSCLVTMEDITDENYGQFLAIISNQQLPFQSKSLKYKCAYFYPFFFLSFYHHCITKYCNYT